MREHKYKAKRLDNGEWVEGYYWKNGCGNYFIRVIKELEEIVLLDYEIDPNTLCEFTGTVDNDKKLVWENDIVLKKDNMLEVVEFNSWNYWYGLQVLGFSLPRNNFKVIGNIFDNPELLEVK